MPVLRDEGEVPIGIDLRLGTPLNRFAKSRHCLWPKGDPPWNRRLLAGVIEYRRIEVDGRDGERCRVGLSQPAVDSQKNHRVERHVGFHEDLPQFAGLEHPGTVCIASLPHRFFIWLAERWSESHWSGDQPRVKRELEHRPRALDLVAKCDRASGLRKGSTKSFEIVAGQVGHETSSAKFSDETVAGDIIVVECPLRNFARLHQMLFGREKTVGQIAKGQSVAGHSRRAAGLQIIPLIKILLDAASGSVQGPK